MPVRLGISPIAWSNDDRGNRAAFLPSRRDGLRRTGLCRNGGSIAGDRHHPLSGRPRLGASGWPASAIMSGFWRGSQKTLEPQSEHECRLLS